MFTSRRPKLSKHYLVGVCYLCALVNWAGAYPCKPRCRWSCEDLQCPTVCAPNCTRLPDCAIHCSQQLCSGDNNSAKGCSSCTSRCSEPVCTVRCPAGAACQNVGSYPDSKTSCEIGCAADCLPPKCQTLCRPHCSISCLPVQCVLECKPAKEVCEAPKCVLECPTTCDGQTDQTSAQPSARMRASTQCCPCNDPDSAKLGFEQAMNSALKSSDTISSSLPSFQEAYDSLREKHLQGDSGCCPCVVTSDNVHVAEQSINIGGNGGNYGLKSASPFSSFLEVNGERSRTLHEILFNEFIKLIINSSESSMIQQNPSQRSSDNSKNILSPHLDAYSASSSSWQLDATKTCLELIIGFPSQVEFVCIAVSASQKNCTDTWIVAQIDGDVISIEGKGRDENTTFFDMIRIPHQLVSATNFVNVSARIVSPGQVKVNVGIPVDSNLTFSQEEVTSILAKAQVRDSNARSISEVARVLRHIIDNVFEQIETTRDEKVRSQKQSIQDEARESVRLALIYHKLLVRRGDQHIRE